MAFDLTSNNSENITLRERLRFVVRSDGHAIAVANSIFYDKNLVVFRRNAGETTERLVRGQDYRTVFKVPELRSSSGNHSAYAGIELLSFDPDSQYFLSYRSVGVSASFSRQQIQAYFEENYEIDLITFFAVVLPSGGLATASDLQNASVALQPATLTYRDPIAAGEVANNESELDQQVSQEQTSGSGVTPDQLAAKADSAYVDQQIGTRVGVGEFNNMVAGTHQSVKLAVINSNGEIADPVSGRKVVSQTPTPIGTPVGFRWGNYPFRLSRTNGAVLCNLDITSFIPKTGTDYYVDPTNITGVAADGAAGTFAAPLRNLSAALAKTDAKKIIIRLGSSDFFARTSASWNNAQPASNAAVIVESTGGRFVSLQCASAVLPVWTQNGTYANVYTTPITSANCSAISDLQARVAHPGMSVMSNWAAAIMSKVARPFRRHPTMRRADLVRAQCCTWS